MKNVTIEKAKLVEIVKKNREAHRAIFLEALDGWRAECIKELGKWYEDAKANKITKAIYISLPRPTDHTREYDRALQMLELEVNSTVILSNEDFAHLVQDDWEWKHQFITSNSRYSTSAAALNVEED